jgi:hypothetical protein
VSAAGGHTSPARFVLAANGDLINVAFIRRIHVSGGTVMADMEMGADIALTTDLTLINELRRLLPINGR